MWKIVITLSSGSAQCSINNFKTSDSSTTLECSDTVTNELWISVLEDTASCKASANRRTLSVLPTPALWDLISRTHKLQQCSQNVLTP